MADYNPEQLWSLYEKLPDDLKETIFSEKTALVINDVCEKNGLQKEVSQVAKYTGYVLLGLLSPEDFQKALQEELKLNAEEAAKAAREIQDLVFFPVKSSLETLYQVEIEKPADVKKPLDKKSVDKYREPIDE